MDLARVFRRLAALVTLPLLLAGCATLMGPAYAPAGMSKAQVLSTYGRPSDVVPLPNGGERLQYSGQPAAQWAIMVDLDAQGRVVQSVQALTEASFNRIQVGVWTRDDIYREFGRPAIVDRVASWNGVIWTYRWYDGADRFFYVYYDANFVVGRAHPGFEFRSGPDRVIR
jgi:hypothetical protein